MFISRNQLNLLVQTGFTIVYTSLAKLKFSLKTLMFEDVFPRIQKKKCQKAFQYGNNSVIPGWMLKTCLSVEY